MKLILITGAKGFIGSHLAQSFKQHGYQTFGIGHGSMSIEEYQSIGLDYWNQSDITIESLKKLNQKFDVIIHCGGSGSVGFSVNHPYEDFKKTVDGTLEVLEYIRLYNSEAHLIYPSSPAVQGEHPDTPIKEDYVGKPASPYGYHKKIAEDLCQSYSKKFDLKVSVIRLFSVYGNGLKKQLLWDACHKIIHSEESAEFWGTGEETRDFIHVNDVSQLIEKVILIADRFIILNGGSGERVTVKELILIIANLLKKNININFDGRENIGNPKHYWADTQKINTIEYYPKIKLENGVKEYIKWFNLYHEGKKL